jgi:hypothetical protein
MLLAGNPVGGGDMPELLRDQPVSGGDMPELLRDRPVSGGDVRVSGGDAPMKPMDALGASQATFAATRTDPKSAKAAKKDADDSGALPRS